MFAQLRVPFTRSLEDRSDRSDTFAPTPQVTPHNNYTSWTLQGLSIDVSVTIQPGIYIKDPHNSRWNRVYGGEHEELSLEFYDPFNTDTTPFYERDYYVRPYATYNRQKVNGKWRWVRIDGYPDLLNIDNTDLVQGIRPLTYLEDDQENQTAKTTFTFIFPI